MFTPIKILFFLVLAATSMCAQGVVQVRRGMSLDVESLTELLRETEEHHGKYEPTAPKHHWSGWYAAYMAARLRGRAPEEAAEEGKRRIEGPTVAGTGGERTNVA